MRTEPSILQFLKERECAKCDPYTNEALEEAKRIYTEAIAYIKAKDTIPYDKYISLKPLALEILYSFEEKKLPYYTEINKARNIIRILNKHI